MARRTVGKRMSGTDTVALPGNAQQAARMIDLEAPPLDAAPPPVPQLQQPEPGFAMPDLWQQAEPGRKWTTDIQTSPRDAYQSQDISLMSVEPNRANYTPDLEALQEYSGESEFDTLAELFKSEEGMIRDLTGMDGHEWGFEALQNDEGRYYRGPYYEGDENSLPPSPVPLPEGSRHGLLHSHPPGDIPNQFSYEDLDWANKHDLPLGMVSPTMGAIYRTSERPRDPVYLPRYASEDFEVFDAPPPKR
jgi:hypothetical protein